MPKIVSAALKALALAKPWTFEAIGPEAKVEAKAVKFGLETKA